MGFQISAGYERLTASKAVEKKQPTKPRKCRLLGKMRGRFRGFRVTSTRRLNWKAFPMVIMPKRVSGTYGNIVKRMVISGACPAIVLSCQWGFPVLSLCKNQR